jgi:hypothetical protein
VLNKSLDAIDASVDAVRKQIVATTEGGAITGEERLREHTDQLYGAMLNYEGKPGSYQLANIKALQRELDDVTRQFAIITDKDLPALNASLKAKNRAPVAAPPLTIAMEEDDDDVQYGAGARTGAVDRDALTERVSLPSDFQRLR